MVTARPGCGRRASSFVVETVRNFYRAEGGQLGLLHVVVLKSGSRPYTGFDVPVNGSIIMPAQSVCSRPNRAAT
jgi:hypothetical protein